MSWKTETEIRFVNSLGSNYEYSTDRETLLRRYLRTMGLRDNWGDIDKVAVRNHVIGILNNLKYKALK